MDKEKRALSEIIHVFYQITVECISLFFQKKGIDAGNWSVVQRFTLSSDNILIMGGASENFRSIFAIGLNKDTIEELTGINLSESNFSDTFGEFANTYCGLLMDNTEFVSRFGILNQTVPILYTKGIPFLPFISGVQGTVNVNGKNLSVGYAIQRVKNIT